MQHAQHSRGGLQLVNSVVAKQVTLREEEMFAGLEQELYAEDDLAEDQGADIKVSHPGGLRWLLLRTRALTLRYLMILIPEGYRTRWLHDIVLNLRRASPGCPTAPSRSWRPSTARHLGTC